MCSSPKCGWVDFHDAIALANIGNDLSQNQSQAVALLAYALFEVAFHTHQDHEGCIRHYIDIARHVCPLSDYDRINIPSFVR